MLGLQGEVRVRLQLGFLRLTITDGDMPGAPCWKLTKCGRPGDCRCSFARGRGMVRIKLGLETRAISKSATCLKPTRCGPATRACARVKVFAPLTLQLGSG